MGMTIAEKILKAHLVDGEMAQGQEIGKVGSTGNSTGNHCHFEVYSGGTLISARQFFPGM